MTISIQTLHDALFALLVTVGIAATLSILMIGAEALHLHSKNRKQATHHSVHTTKSEDSRELILH